MLPWDADQRGASHRDGNEQSHCLLLDQLLSEARLAHWLELMANVCRGILLRLNGLVQLAEHPDKPTVIHSVQWVIHPLRQLSGWPLENLCSRLVLIVQDHYLRSS